MNSKKKDFKSNECGLEKHSEGFNINSMAFLLDIHSQYVGYKKRRVNDRAFKVDVPFYYREGLI